MESKIWPPSRRRGALGGFLQKRPEQIHSEDCPLWLSSLWALFPNLPPNDQNLPHDSFQAR